MAWSQQNLFEPPSFDIPKPPTRRAMFDRDESLSRKDAGQIKAIENNAVLVTEAREIAIEIATRQGLVDLDDVMAEMVNRGYGVHCLGNSAGRLLSGDRRFAPTNEITVSRRIHANGNRIRRWKLKLEVADAR